MTTSRLISLRLQSNIANYKIMVYSSSKCSYEIINSLDKYVSFFVNEQTVEIIAVPLTSGYSQKLCFVLDTQACKCCLNLVLDFQETPVEDALYTFYLTDKTYDLPVDGILHFN